MNFNLLQAIFPFFVIVAVGFLLGTLIIVVKKLIRGLLPLPKFEQLHKMDGVSFERGLRQIFEREGWKVELTRRTGDFGADLVLSKNGRKVVVQAKRWSRKVGIKAVQEVIGARDVYRADEAWVVTTSSFTDAAIKQAQASQVRLKDGRWLLRTLDQLNPKSNEQLISPV